MYFLLRNGFAIFLKMSPLVNNNHVMLLYFGQNLLLRYMNHNISTEFLVSLTVNGIVSQINNFLKVLKIKSVLSVYAPIVFEFFCCLVMEKIKDKVLACFYENTY
jgi:hypothetical protein